MQRTLLKPRRDPEHALQRAASGPLRKWIDQQHPGEYSRWQIRRVADVAERGFRAWAQPISDAALKVLLVSPAAAERAPFKTINDAWAAIDMIQGGPRVFSNEEWDGAIDTWYAAKKHLAANPDKARAFFANGGSLLHWAPGVRNGSSFPTVGELRDALASVAGSSYARPFQGLSTTNLALIPFYTHATEGADRGAFDVVCTLRFAIEKSPTVDRLLLNFYPLYGPDLERMSTRNGFGANDYAEPANPALTAWTYYDGGSHGYPHASMGVGTCYTDPPITYRLPLNEESVKIARTSRLQPQLWQALTDAGYKQSATKSIPWGSKGPRAFSVGHGGVSGIRHPAGRE